MVMRKPMLTSNVDYKLPLFSNFITYRDIPVARTVEASKLLCTRMFGKLKDNSKNSLKLLSASVECLLWSTHYLQVLSEHNCEQTLSDVFDTLNKTLKTWIAVKDVIGGSVFGATVSSSMSYLWSTTWKGKEELEVFNIITGYTTY